MSTVIDDAVEKIDGRLELIRDEIGRLEDAKTALKGRPRRSRESEIHRVRVAQARRRVAPPPRRRARSGQRTRTVLNLITDKPGATTTDLIKVTGMAGPQVYGIVRRLRVAKQVTGDHKTGWRPTVA